jgi:hypothetical protein
MQYAVATEQGKIIAQITPEIYAVLIKQTSGKFEEITVKTKGGKTKNGIRLNIDIVWDIGENEIYFDAGSSIYPWEK